MLARSIQWLAGCSVVIIRGFRDIRVFALEVLDLIEVYFPLLCENVLSVWPPTGYFITNIYSNSASVR